MGYKNKTFYSLLIVLALAGYLLPWLSLGANGLTYNGYDLAEWTTLNPAVQVGTPPLLPSLLLRLSLVCVALLVVLIGTQSKWLKLVFLTGFTIALLPPFEFLANSANPNYRQQFGLSVFTFLAGLALLRVSKGYKQNAIAIGLSLISLTSLIWGVTQTYGLMERFNIPVLVNFGFGLYLLCFLIIAVRSIIHQQNKAAS